MSLDIVIPAHNEEHRIATTLASYRRTFHQPDVRFRVALDGCTDGTAAIVAAHARADRRVRLHHYPKLGKGGVLMETFRRCRADLVAFVDADAATPPGELARLVADLGTADGLIASRRLPASIVPARRRRGRALTSVGFAWLVRRGFGLPYTDTQCGAKVLRRHVVEAAVPRLSSRDLMFDVDLLATARRLGFEIVEQPTVWIDQDGSRVRARRDAPRMFVSALRLWLHLRIIPVGGADAAPTTPSHRQEHDRAA